MGLSNLLHVRAAARRVRRIQFLRNDALEAKSSDRLKQSVAVSFGVLDTGCRDRPHKLSHRCLAVQIGLAAQILFIQH